MVNNCSGDENVKDWKNEEGKNYNFDPKIAYILHTVTR